MKIRVFNPEHDLALASNMERFTSPHAGRQLRNDLSFLPALWADEGDVVVVNEVDAANEAWKALRKVNKVDVEFCTLDQLSTILEHEKGRVEAVDPWGWDLAIRFQFLQAGVPENLLPSKETVAEVRRLSGRQMTTSMLEKLRDGLKVNTCGESIYVTDEESFNAILLKEKNIVAKAPWSSSGRGVRYFFEGKKTENAANWIVNTIRLQGGVMVEPLYNKVKDFGMEFERLKDGSVRYLGLSLFETRNGAYTGNILATESEKREMMAQYLDLALLDEVTARLERLLSELLMPLGALPLCLGVDMMVVAKEKADGFLLHPCVEINLRRTMGHVALAVSPLADGHQGSMAVVFEGKKYKFKQ